MTHAAMRPSTATRRTGGGQPMPDGPGPRGKHDLRGEQDLVGDRDRDDGNDRDDRTERDEQNSRDEQSEQRARREQDARREDRADDRDERDERDSRDEQSDQRQRTDRAERDGRRGQDSRREQDQRGEQGRAGDRGERGSRDARGEQRNGDRGELSGGRESRREPGGVQRTREQVTDRIRPVTTNPVDAFAVTPDMSKVVTAWFDMAFDMMKLQQQFFANMLGAGNTNERNTTKV